MWEYIAQARRRNLITTGVATLDHYTLLMDTSRRKPLSGDTSTTVGLESPAVSLASSQVSDTRGTCEPGTCEREQPPSLT